ncbi:MAG: hypothetical protein A3H35_07935 [Betaproteobacteria bacterium RIFCSPLOWO2_02_FULL_62_17]|nr:MAG: hypothetical protein A3H35_07935 [Betaproteobacteria bacterium RIFCSPLOWO2_02_FULL_62_17]
MDVVGTNDISITEKTLRARFLCSRKSHLLMFSRDSCRHTAYEAAVIARMERIRSNYLFEAARKGVVVTSFPRLSSDKLADGQFFAHLLSTEAAVFTAVETSDFEAPPLEPVIFSSSKAIRQEDRAEITFAGYVLSRVQRTPLIRGKVILFDGSQKMVRLHDGFGSVLPAINELTGWASSSPQAPDPILNKHCPVCEFQHLCRPVAERNDSISLLGGIGTKDLLRYERKGIFTIKQLSSLYRPRKRRRHTRLQPVTHKFELQALALRTGHIYLDGEPIPIPQSDTEIYFDIEALPDIQYNYLIGAVVCTAGKARVFQFWADQRSDEASVWCDFLALIARYPGCPLFHYGGFERLMIKRLGTLYGTLVEPIVQRLVNINSCIFGKIYFPVRSNSLKDICRFIGLSWTSPEASGLQSLAWRYRYDDTGDQQCRDLLLTYNREDCENLRGLTKKLRDIAAQGPHSPEVRFADAGKASLTEEVSDVVGSLNQLLRSAHGSYEQTKIVLKRSATAGKRGDNPQLSRPGRRPSQGKIYKVVHVRPGRTCPRHPGVALNPRSAEAFRTITDLVFTSRGVRKTIVQYVGNTGYCAVCNNEYSPPSIRRLGRQQKYGSGLQAWATYHRMALRLPFDKISQLLEDVFHVQIPPNHIYNLVSHFSQNYVVTERRLLAKILASPVVYVDETTINIQGTSQYVWVITDGRHVVFRQTESREATIIHHLFDGYSGVLCTDFYPGYDSIDCAQQKCWAHLIRDLNDDLRKTPFDAELECFVSSVRNLIVPIFGTMDESGLKSRRLRKFRKSVDRFYREQIVGKTYRSDLVATYQKRFAKYRDKLFVFIDRDGVPWNNNMAERALRHIAVQRKISGSFGKHGILPYLLLLGVTQSCRFQNKSLLQFLVSGKKDIDLFKGQRGNIGWRMR